MKTSIPIKRALLSVSDKTGLIEFAAALTKLNIEIISTGGTSATLREANIPHRQVEDITGLPSMLSGRVKTLHPIIHGGILGLRDKHAEEAAQHQIGWIDLVVVNFYPFSAATKNKNLSWQEAVEYIDIGGPTMVRAAAKNFAWVGAVVDPHDYQKIITELETQQGLSVETRKYLAEKVFAVTAQYDATVHQYFLLHADKTNTATIVPDHLYLPFKKQAELRYGENPHQKAFAYQADPAAGVLSAKQHQGKPLSYNNILDAEAAWACVQEFVTPTCIIVKHANPCGAATAETIDVAFARALAADSISAFGGIVALNRPCTKETAEQIAKIFMEVILAPDYSEEALAIFAAKPNLRILEMVSAPPSTWEMKCVTGGMLMQEKDLHTLKTTDLKMVTQKKPNADEIESMLFAWRVLKHIKSNAILIAKDDATVGVGAGQVSRIDAVDMAVRKAGDNIQKSILASDAFFPFRDSIDRIANLGIHAIIQPGGSQRDDEVIAACDEHGIAMVFTGKRCFRH